MLTLKDLTKSYSNGHQRRAVLKSVNYTFNPGTMYAVVGPSGSGKTTMLSLASGLDEPSSGSVSLLGKDVSSIGLDRYRNRHVATVFQSLNLLNYMNAIQNVTTAMEITGVKGVRKKRAIELLDKLGIEREDQHRKVLQLSGGQQQRVAIARAMACDVDVLFADEPTGSLDEETADGIITLFQKMAHEEGKCVIVVTHSPRVAKSADSVLTLQRGKLMS